MLVLARYAVLAAILYQIRTGLVKTERHPGSDTLGMHVKNPVVIQRAGVFARLSPNRNLLDLMRVKILPQVYPFKHRSHNHKPVLYGQRQEYGHTIVATVLILNRAAHGHMPVALAPVGRQTLGKTLDALGKEKECAVGAPADYMKHSANSVPAGYLKFRRRSSFSGRLNDDVFLTTSDGTAAPKAASSRYT